MILELIVIISIQQNIRSDTYINQDITVDTEYLTASEQKTLH